MTVSSVFASRSSWDEVLIRTRPPPLSFLSVIDRLWSLCTLSPNKQLVLPALETSYQIRIKIFFKTLYGIIWHTIRHHMTHYTASDDALYSIIWRTSFLNSDFPPLLMESTDISKKNFLKIVVQDSGLTLFTVHWNNWNSLPSNTISRNTKFLQKPSG